MKTLLMTGVLFALSFLGCGGSSKGPVTCQIGVTACVKGASGDVCAAVCTPDGGTTCPSGQSCRQEQGCCTGVGCAGIISYVCCGPAGC